MNGRIDSDALWMHSGFSQCREYLPYLQAEKIRCAFKGLASSRPESSKSLNFRQKLAQPAPPSYAAGVGSRRWGRSGRAEWTP